VVNNLAALGVGSLFAIGATGDDGEGYDLRNELERRGCRTDGLLRSSQLMTPTYLKPRNARLAGLAGEHERYDTKNRRRTSADVVAQVVSALDRILPEIDALIVADQVEEEDCGVVTAQVREVIAERARSFPRVIFSADSRRRIRSFRNVIIKPNQFEAVGHENPGPSDRVELDALQTAVQKLRAQVGAPVCATRAEHGMLVSDPELTSIPAVRVEGPIDPTGAGDSVTAGLVLALASGATLPEAGLVGLLVASITIQQLSTTGTATPAQLIDRLDLWRAQHA
jgi:bifunctional ADP-heptose synthase (sugar kinase/adenylyltransferase)